VRNWSHTVSFSSSEVARPRDLDELRSVVAASERVRALGTRHSFNRVGDTVGTHVLLDAMPRHLVVSADRSEVTCDAATTHAELSTALAAHGLALPNLCSSPHLGVVGAVQTGAHGSGVDQPALAAHVTRLELVDGTGALRTVAAGDPDLDAVSVGLGAFGVVHRITQRVVPAFEMSQTVDLDLGWDALLPHLHEVAASAYSVSLFTRYDDRGATQVWRKHRLGDPEVLDLRDLGARPATETLHPLPASGAQDVTPQLGVPGPSHERLPHVHPDVCPRFGSEIQSEYLLDAARALEAIEALRGLADRLDPLLAIAEIRHVGADSAWLSPSGGRDSVALHFTWQRLPEELGELLPVVEAALLPLGARPHWGKAFACSPHDLRAAYPRIEEWGALVGAYDPERRFRNDLVDALLDD
jgi:xylitol oxidase